MRADVTSNIRIKFMSHLVCAKCVCGAVDIDEEKKIYIFYDIVSTNGFMNWITNTTPLFGIKIKIFEYIK